jgi:hypothetical protein
VIATQPTTIAVAAPIAVTFLSRIRSRANQATRVQAGQRRVLVKARTEGWPTPNPLPPLKPNQPNHSSPAPSSTYIALWGRRAWRP